MKPFLGLSIAGIRVAACGGTPPGGAPPGGSTAGSSSQSGTRTNSGGGMAGIDLTVAGGVQGASMQLAKSER